MRIKTVRLENIRSHVESEVPFQGGFNCLVGGLGWGKSSILYAIDFALFGDPLGRSFDYLLREGKDSGKVVVHFTHGGKNYTISRGIAKKGKGISQDTEELKLLEENKVIASARSEAVAEQLKAITGIDKDVFREVIWVRQEHLKELLDVTPRERQKRFDELFGLSDYEVAWTNLASSLRDYKNEKDYDERDPDVVATPKLQTDYNKAVEEFSIIENELSNFETKLAQAESALKEAISRLQNLEELRRKTEELRRKEAQLQSDIANIEEALARLFAEMEKKQDSVKELEERLNSMEMQKKSQYEALEKIGLKPEPTIEELREHLKTLEHQIANILGEQEATKKEILNTQKRVSNLATENKCPLCSQTLTEDYKKELIRQSQEENSQHEKRFAELRKDIDLLEKLRGIIAPVISNLQSLNPVMEEIEKRLVKEQESLGRLSKEIAEKQEKEKHAQSKLDTVRTEIAKFDVAELENAQRIRDAAFQQHSNVKSDLKNMERLKNDISLRMNNLKERLDNAQQKIDKMKKIEKLLGVLDGIRGVYRSIQPKLRSEFITYLQRVVQQVLDTLVGGVGPMLIVKIDETYTPLVRSEEGYERDVTNLSGGERTLLAFAYRIGLGQLIMQSRTGHGLYMLLLDEPTESLGREDGSIDRLAEAISRLKAIEQIIAVTHSEAFAEKAEHVIRLEKEAGVSRVTVER
jgi:exonuclease SbcC